MDTPLKATTSKITKTDQDWLDYAQTEIQRAPERLEDTAKFLVGIISIVFSIFITKRPEGMADDALFWLKLAAACWLLAMLIGFFVLFPTRYPVNTESPEDIQFANQRITSKKRAILMGSVVSFFLGLLFAFWAFYIGY